MDGVVHCHGCGGEFVATVVLCPDCGLELLDEAPVEREGEAFQPDDVVAFPLPSVSPDQLQLVRTMLDQAGIPHEWDRVESRILAGARHRIQVDEVLDEVAALTIDSADDQESGAETTALDRLRMLVQRTDRWGRPNH